jgi:hypothetical protein
MNMNQLKLVAGIAWAGAALSSATPASARIYTPLQCAYTNCSSSWNYNASSACDVAFNYRQNMKVVSTTCATGACVQDSYTLPAEYVYATGRKLASMPQQCNSINIYELSGCSC